MCMKVDQFMNGIDNIVNSNCSLLDVCGGNLFVLGIDDEIIQFFDVLHFCE